MTLRDLIAAHPDRFYAQTWYAGEEFMDLMPRPVGWPTEVVPAGAA